MRSFTNLSPIKLGFIMALALPKPRATSEFGISAPPWDVDFTLTGLLFFIIDYLTVRDGRISDPAIWIRPDFHYPVKSGSGRIARGTPDRIFASYNTCHSLRMMSLRS